MIQDGNKNKISAKRFDVVIERKNAMQCNDNVVIEVPFQHLNLFMNFDWIRSNVIEKEGKDVPFSCSLNISSF